MTPFNCRKRKLSVEFGTTDSTNNSERLNFAEYKSTAMTEIKVRNRLSSLFGTGEPQHKGQGNSKLLRDFKGRTQRDLWHNGDVKKITTYLRPCSSSSFVIHS